MKWYEIPQRDQVFLSPWLGDYLYEVRVKGSEVAAAMHLDQSIIHHWIKGSRPVAHNRLEGLAAALGFDMDELLEHARIVKNGYQNEAACGHPDNFHVARTMLAEVVPVNIPDIATPASDEESLPPSEYGLLWCASEHGTGVYRRHHHGPAPMLGPLSTIAAWTRERDPAPYVRPQSSIPHVSWRARSTSVVAPAVERPQPGPSESRPDVILGKDVLIDPSQWRPFVTAHHRGHLALGVACTCECS